MKSYELLAFFEAFCSLEKRLGKWLFKHDLFLRCMTMCKVWAFLVSHFGIFLVNLEQWLHLTLPLPSRCTGCYWLVVSIWPKTGKNSCWKKPRTYLAGAHGGRCSQKHPAVGKWGLQGFFGAGWLCRKRRKFTYEGSMLYRCIWMRFHRYYLILLIVNFWTSFTGKTLR